MSNFNYGEAVDDLDYRGRMNRDLWRPIMPPADHPDSPRIEQIKSELRAQRRKDKYFSAKTLDERELVWREQRRADDYAKQEQEEIERAWIGDNAAPLARLQEIRESMLSEGSERKASEFVEVDLCAKQFSTVGACEDTGFDMLAKIELRERQRLEVKQGALQVQLAALAQQSEAIRQKLAPPEPVETQEPSDAVSEATDE